MAETVATLYQQTHTTQDPFLSQSALHELLFAFQAEQTRVILVLNRFDRFCQVATYQMLNTLRGLRDSFKETLCYIVGMRQEVAFLPDPEALGDMYELLDNRVCWVGPLSEADARRAVTRRTAPQSPTEDEVQTMLALAGAFPVLLKAISYWWRDTSRKPAIGEWLATLTVEHSIQYRLDRLWSGLTVEEQLACAAVREWQELVATAPEKSSILAKARESLSREHGHLLPCLAVKGLCRETEEGWTIRGALMADYVKRMEPSGRGRVWIDVKTGDIYQGSSTRLSDLAPQEDTLLRFLIRNPYKRHSYSELLDVVFADDMRMPQDLFSLVRSVRKQIELLTARPRHIINYKAQKEGGYQFYPEGRPSYRPERGDT
jgi:hypothetical protein